MTAKLTGIDHVHIYVANWGEAEKWYQTVLGFKRIEALMAWAVPNGPLTIENPEGTIHLALFETESDSKSISAVAFGASGEEFLVWKDKLENHGLELRITDHKLAYSLYFRDPWENLFEITTYEHDFVREQLAG